jgi:phosphatidate cytidylyltransferase
VLTASVFGPCFVVLAWRGEHYFVLMVNLLTVVGSFEYSRMLRQRGAAPDAAVGYLAAIALPWSMYRHVDGATGLTLGVLLAVLVARALARGQVQGTLAAMAATWFGIFHVSWLGAHLVLLRELPAVFALEYDSGFAFVLLAFVLVWVSDTGAYLVGTLFGRHRLAPQISPGKSLEGAVAALVLTAAAGAGLAATLLRDVMSPLTGAWLGVAGSTVGQLGDLLVSLLKRDAKMKDASNIIPGHGGVLDRFDSVLLTAPLLYYALRFFIL